MSNIFSELIVDLKTGFHDEQDAKLIASATARNVNTIGDTVKDML